MAWNIANIIVCTCLTEWKNLVRMLGVMEHDIEVIEYNYCRDLKEQCRQGIYIWWEECDLDEEEKLRSLLDALKELSLQNAIGKYIYILVFTVLSLDCFKI